MYVAFIVIGFVPMKQVASFLRSPLHRVHKAGNKTFWEMLFNTQMRLLAASVAR